MDGSFPDPKCYTCPVIQIATTYQVYGETELRKELYSLGSCDDIEGCKVVVCKDEKELLDQWALSINRNQVDVLIGYNIWKFDLWYMWVRAEYVGCDYFFNMGKKLEYESIIKDSKFSSSAYGDNFYKMVYTPGMFQLDLLVIMQREHKLVSYSLNAVSEHFLNDKKVDMPYGIMFEKFTQGPAERAEIGIYCIKDTELPQLLVNKLTIIPNMIEMAKATWVPLNYLTERGQQIKVYSQILQQTRNDGMLVQTLEKNTTELFLMQKKVHIWTSR